MAEIRDGKGASMAGKAFARMPFSKAADEFLEAGHPHVAPSTHRLHFDLLKPLRAFFEEKVVMRLTAAE